MSKHNYRITLEIPINCSRKIAVKLANSLEIVASIYGAPSIEADIERLEDKVEVGALVDNYKKWRESWPS